MPRYTVWFSSIVVDADDPKTAEDRARTELVRTADAIEVEDVIVDEEIEQKFDEEEIVQIVREEKLGDEQYDN